jgi:hypothetical protein
MMKNCQFYDANIIAGYFDGTLDDETEAAFSEHLLGCSRCLEALLDLEKDMFLMESMKMGPVPKRHRSGFALFHMVRGRLDIVQNLVGEHRFRELPLTAVRGREHRAHAFERDGISVQVEGEGDHTFRIELDGVAGKNIEVRRNGKIVERHSAEQKQRAIFRYLERGSFALFINNQEFIHFFVQ